MTPSLLGRLRTTFVPEINVWGGRSDGPRHLHAPRQGDAKAAHWFSEHVEDPDFEGACGNSAEIFRVLRADDRLIFRYANHEPEVWVALFSAFQHSGFHAVGCVAVHAENEPTSRSATSTRAMTTSSSSSPPLPSITPASDLRTRTIPS